MCFKVATRADTNQLTQLYRLVRGLKYLMWKLMIYFFAHQIWKIQCFTFGEKFIYHPCNLIQYSHIECHKFFVEQRFFKC